MNEQKIARYSPHSEIDLSASMAESEGGSYMLVADHESALAAKNARIAELEKVLDLAIETQNAKAAVDDELAACRARIAELEETNRNNVACYEMQLNDLRTAQVALAKEWQRRAVQFDNFGKDHEERGDMKASRKSRSRAALLRTHAAELLKIAEAK